MPDNAAGALAGIRVVDLGTFVAGSFGATLMGDMGAEVVKIEPLTGDPARGVPPFLNGESRFFIGLNRNKRSLALDLRRKEGRAIALRLIERADVLLDNFRPGSAARLGLDPPTLRRLNPRLIHCTASGFGQRGPLSSHPAFDGALQAMAGIARANVRSFGREAHCGVLVVDYSTALLSLGAISTALYHRERTGEGQTIELSLLQSAMTVMASSYVEAVDHQPSGPVGGYPYRMFETADGNIFVGVAQNRFWKGFCDAVGRPDLGGDPRYAVHAERGAFAEELNAIFEPIFRRQSSEEWHRRLTEVGVPCGPVLGSDELFAHPQVEALDMRQRVQHTGVGDMDVAGPPFYFHRTPAAVQGPAPRLGEHSGEVLRELGYGEEEVEDLLGRDVVRQSRSVSTS